MKDQSQRPSLIVVDDDQAIIECVGLCLQRGFDVRILGYASHAQAGVALALDQRPDVVLMDIHMPGADAFWACREIVALTGGQTRILFYTGFPSDQNLDRCLDAGGAGMISKHSEGLENVALAVRHVLRGQRYFSPELADRLVHLECGAPRSRFSTLARRELEVLRLLAAGRTNRQIARRLDISLRSVEKEIADLKQKLHVATTAEVLMLASREGLLYPELLQPSLPAAHSRPRPGDCSQTAFRTPTTPG